jgi:Aromatic-ring-opening dioxygenase LigAB, LigA subunit
MASNFTNFLLALGEDPQILEAFKQDPEAVMDEAGLTPAEKTLLMSGNMQLIRLAIVNDPDHKVAMGIPSEQNLPARMPMLVHP